MNLARLWQEMLGAVCTAQDWLCVSIDPRKVKKRKSAAAKNTCVSVLVNSAECQVQRKPSEPRTTVSDRSTHTSQRRKWIPHTLTLSLDLGHIFHGPVPCSMCRHFETHASVCNRGKSSFFITRSSLERGGITQDNIYTLECAYDDKRKETPWETTPRFTQLLFSVSVYFRKCFLRP